MRKCLIFLKNNGVALLFLVIFDFHSGNLMIEDKRCFVPFSNEKQLQNGNVVVDTVVDTVATDGFRIVRQLINCFSLF